MRKIKYAENGKIIPQKFTMQQIEEADDRQVGFCVACASERECCEPDARCYSCEECGNKLVFGAQEIALRGWVKGGIE